MNADRIARLTESETRRFVETHPGSRALHERARDSMPHGYPMAWGPGMYAHGPIFATDGGGARFRDVDGHEYIDFNLADMSLFCGFAPAPVAEAVARRAAIGGQFLLPNEDAIVVAEELARRYCLALLAIHPRGHLRQSGSDPPGQGRHGARNRGLFRRAISRA